MRELRDLAGEEHGHLRPNGGAQDGLDERQGALQAIEDRGPGRLARALGAVEPLVDEARATLKRLFRFGSEVELRPANSQLESTRLHASRVQIQGIFRGLLRPNA